MAKDKTDKIIVTELHLGEPLKKFLRREYKERTISELTALIIKKTGLHLHRTTVWSWLKLYNIRRKQWK